MRPFSIMTTRLGVVRVAAMAVFLALGGCDSNPAGPSAPSSSSSDSENSGAPVVRGSVKAKDAPGIKQAGRGVGNKAARNAAPATGLQ